MRDKIKMILPAIIAFVFRAISARKFPIQFIKGIIMVETY